MTYRELRLVLFHVDKQDMTVKELRKILFEKLDDDEGITPDGLRRLTSDKYDTIYYQKMLPSGAFSEIRRYQPTSDSDYLRVLDIFKNNPEEYHQVF